MNKPLDPEFVSEVIRLAESMNGHQIAKHLNVDKNRVWYVLKKNKVTPKRSHFRPVSEVLKVVRYSKLNGQRAAMKEFNLTKDQVSRCMKRYRKLEQSFIDREPQLRQAAISHAMVQAGSRIETAEEFASYCVERFITNQKNIFFHTAYADFMRERYGRDTHKSRGEKNTHADGKVHDKTYDPQTEDTYGLLPKSLSGLVVVLVYKYGFTMREIGHYLGCGEAAISMRIKRTLEGVKKRHGRDLEGHT